MSFGKAVSTANELATILASGDDEESLAKVGRTLSEATSTQHGVEDQVKSAIEKLQQLLVVEEERKSDADSEESRSLEALKEDREATEKQIGSLEQEFKDLQQRVVDKENTVETVRARKTDVSNSKNDVLPKSKYNFSLYTNITHIRWEYDGADDQVKGFVASLKDVKPFCLSSAQNSKFFIANYLWDLIDVWKKGRQIFTSGFCLGLNVSGYFD